jgi:dipeptidyl aminopeptidase/acylaminoacyl peptidase
MKKHLSLLTIIGMNILFAQNTLTPEALWQLGRVTPIGLSKDKKEIVFKVSTPDIKENKSNSKTFKISVSGGTATMIENYDDIITNKNLSPDGQWLLKHKEVKLQAVHGKDFYQDVEKSNVQVYNSLDYRHWDKWNEGKFNHVGYGKLADKEDFNDIMPNEKFHSPQQPFGGDEDYIWHPSGKSIIYVSKKSIGTASATSTNTDLFEYDLATKSTKNLTPSNKGYDTHPDFSPQGHLTWLQMKRDGFEADKQDIIVSFDGVDMNLTAHWDGTVDSFKWSADGNRVYFKAPIGGTVQLFEVLFPGKKRIAPIVKQITDGMFDVTDIVGIDGDTFYLGRTDMNHAKEIYSYNQKTKIWQQITNVNTEFYKKISLPTIEKKIIKTTDDKDMVVWVILPPNFDKTKKYATLLYCQGGPQGALSQSYSYRWNFSLMASQGYVVVAPNRRGMPGHGVAWNEQISKDWGGQVMDDYLSAIDGLCNEKYVDHKRLAAVGASYGGYSVFMLAGIHNKRFKTFISHCGVFNLESMYGTTEEVFFTNFDLGGAYWEKDNAAAQKSYEKFNPIKLVNNWDTPMLVIQGGLDFRVPIGQGQEAFQAAQLKGLKSRFVYFPEENHWVLKPQNALVWQREFFGWLKETL